MKTKIFTFIFIIILILIAAALGIGIYRMKHALPKNETLYESTECPHCEKVMTFIQTQQLHKKITFDQKQLDTSSSTVRELAKVMRFCGYDVNQGIPIPVLWTGETTQKCITGDEDIIQYFKHQLKETMPVIHPLPKK